jgi:GNAT superfamily N-acetyltransferase
MDPKMIRISRSRKTQTADLAALWNRAVLVQGEEYHQNQVSAADLDAVVHKPGLSFEFAVAKDRSDLLGFALGCAQNAGGEESDPGAQPGWLSAVAVEPAHWRQGIGRRLLRALEQTFARQGRTALATQTFRMPFSLLRRPRLDSAPYRFLIACDYRPQSHELYLRNDLGRFHLSDDVARRRHELSAEGIDYRRYEPADREELLALLGRCFSPGWHATIERATADARQPLILTARAGERIVGFMGPLLVTRPGAPGSLGSPGIDPGFRGRGIGKVLVNLGLDYLKGAGASEVCYSTSVTNPARFIYFDSGAELITVYCSSFRKSLCGHPTTIGRHHPRRRQGPR